MCYFRTFYFSFLFFVFSCFVRIFLIFLYFFSSLPPAPPCPLRVVLVVVTVQVPRHIREGSETAIRHVQRTSPGLQRQGAVHRDLVQDVNFWVENRWTQLDGGVHHISMGLSLHRNLLQNCGFWTRVHVYFFAEHWLGSWWRIGSWKRRFGVEIATETWLRSFHFWGQNAWNQCGIIFAVAKALVDTYSIFSDFGGDWIQVFLEAWLGSLFIELDWNLRRDFVGLFIEIWVKQSSTLDRPFPQRDLVEVLWTLDWNLHWDFMEIFLCRDSSGLFVKTCVSCWPKLDWAIHRYLTVFFVEIWVGLSTRCRVWHYD